MLIDTVHLKMDRSLSKNKYSFKKRTASVDKQVIWRVSRDDVEDNSMAEESEKSRFSTPRLNRYGFGRLE